MSIQTLLKTWSKRWFKGSKRVFSLMALRAVERRTQSWVVEATKLVSFLVQSQLSITILGTKLIRVPESSQRAAAKFPL